MMKLLALLPALSTALPREGRAPSWLLDAIKNADLSDTYDECNSTECQKPARKYEKILPIQPGFQWGQHGGYCGAWAMGRAAMGKGAYISQQQVRDHAYDAGGHDNEILTINVDYAFKKLKMKVEGFEYNVLPTPQADAYLKWMKKQLVAGNPLVWMIMFDGQHYPDRSYTQDNTTNGIYSHEEPVVGIMSNHPLSDPTLYDDDAVAYFNDASKRTLYVTMKDIPGTWSKSSERASCPGGRQCMWNERGYFWAVQGFLDEHAAVPLTLSIDPWASEPYTRGGEKPINIAGTLTASGLQKGSEYDIYRWNSAEEAFVYKDAHKIGHFTATDATYVFKDPNNFLSNTATYYRVVPASDGAVIV